MIEENNPIDIGPAETEPYKEKVERLFRDYHFRGKQRCLPDLIRLVDSGEKYIMGDLERDTYLALRLGLQVFCAVNDRLKDKLDYKRILAAVPASEMASHRELMEINDFCNLYALFAAARLIIRKLEPLCAGADDDTPPDLSQVKLKTDQPAEMVIKHLLAPLFFALASHEEGGSFFAEHTELPLFIRQVFERYAQLVLQRKDSFPRFQTHLRGYQFRIMDGLVILNEYEDRGVSATPMPVTELAFQPITAREIVGNRAAKKKVKRYIERLCLFNVETGTNPILEMGGLAWTSLYDGLPGTGKSSLFRMAMTCLRDLAETRAIPFHIISVDQGIKDEFYGKTGKILLEKLAATRNPEVLSLGIFDDIDLLTSARDQAQGADNDINNIIMQYLDGVYTVRRGNVINFAASNKPAGLDDAVRNRFNDRILIDGPVTGEDFADMLNILAGPLLEKGLLCIEQGYQPFATQHIDEEAGDVAAYMAGEMSRYKEATVLEFGLFMKGLKDKNPKITGRSTRAVMEAIKERAADFDVPREWFQKHALFFEQPYETQVGMIAELYTKITPDILFQEARRYFDSEQRFAQTEAEGEVRRGYHNRLWDLEARIAFIKDPSSAEKSAELVRLEEARTQMLREAREEHRRILGKLQAT